MTVAIKESLVKLNDVLQGLEHSATQAEDNAKKNVERAAKSGAKKSPPDLFSVPSSASASASESDVDAKALASRLDSAIEKVENLLKEEA